MNLKQRAIKSTVWFVGSRISVHALGWAVTIVIARFLSPRDYGLFAMGLTVVTTFELFQEFGLGTAIIQRQDLTRRHLNAIFWIVSSVSAAAALALFVLAPAAARFYEEPALVGLTRVMAVAFLFNALGLVPYSLLTKEIDFRRRSLAETLGTVTSAFLSMALAYAGYGVWALTIGHLARAAVRNCALAIACRWLPGTDVSFRGVAEIMKFGLRVTASSGLRSLHPVINRMIVGRFLGGSALGLYTMAESLATGPHRISSSVVQQLSLPLFSKLQGDDQRLRAYFLKITKYLAVLSFPAQIGLALVASELVGVVLSDRWAPMVGLFQALSVGSMIWIVTLPAGPLLVSRGRADVFLRYNIALVGLMTAAFLIGTRFGLPGVAAAWLLVFPVMRLTLVALSMRELRLSPLAWVRSVSPPLLATVSMALGVLSLRLTYLGRQAAAERLAVDVAVGAVVYVAVLFALDRTLFAELKMVLKELASRTEKAPGAARGERGSARRNGAAPPAGRDVGLAPAAGRSTEVGE